MADEKYYPTDPDPAKATRAVADLKNKEDSFADEAGKRAEDLVLQRYGTFYTGTTSSVA